MKRKNTSPPPETREDPETKYELKRVKTNDSEDLIFDNTKDQEVKLHQINLTKRNGESSIDRFLGSLRKENKPSAMENEERTMIVKDLTNTYRTMDDYQKGSPKPSRNGGAFSELRQVRTLAKLNKIDENQQNEDQEFNDKISKKLELMLTSGPMKESEQGRKFESKKTESLKKALEHVKFSKNKDTPPSDYLTMESEDLGTNPKQFSDLTPIKGSAERISPESFRINTADQTPKSDRTTELSIIPEPIQATPGPSTNRKKVVVPPIKYLQAPKTGNTATKQSTPGLQSSSHKSPTSHLLVSANDKNKRRQSFSINDVSSKSKAFLNYSGSAKPENPPQKQQSRRASTVPKPATANTKRKSFYVGESPGKNTPQTSRKSLTPESHMALDDVFRENNLLKKDIDRKNKEIENLKREKLALLRKFKAIDADVFAENQEKLAIEGSIKVYCRVRPSYKGDAAPILTFPELEWMKDQGDTQKFGIKCVEINNTLNKKTPFYFDRVFPPQATQAQIFEEFEPIVDRVINGENMCVISYGQPSSGKSYTLLGPCDSQNLDMELLGIVPRIVDVLLVKAGAERFGGKTLQIQVGCLLVSEGKMADLSVDSEILEGDVEWMSMNSEGKEAEGINERVIWNPIGNVRELLDLLEKTEGMMKNRRYTNNIESQVYLVKVTDEEEREGTLSFMEVLQWNSDPRNQLKGKNRALMAFVNQIQRLFVNNKETFLMFNLSPDEEDYMQAKEALEISQQFANTN